MSPGVKEAVISWDANALHVERLSLVSLASPATITVGGSLGRNGPAGTIDLTFGEMPLQSLTAFVPGLAEYHGTVAGKITLSGVLSAPDIQGAVTVTKGRFRNFPFERLAVTGRNQGLDLQGDVRLDQSEGRWLTLRGTVPTNLFSRSGASRPVDLAVRSSPIDLSVVESFTSLVSSVSGVLEVDVTVKGFSEDPHLTGFVQVAGAAFTVAATGATYANGEMRLALAPDSVQVERFRLEDDKGDPLQLTGSAATHERRLGEFGIELSGSRFEVLQNELGDVDLNGVVTISGTPSAPVISGDLAVHRGDLAIDRLLRYLDRPYATVAQAPVDETNVAVAAVTRWWDRASLRLRLLATNNLTLSGNDLRFSTGAAAGLGNVNVTLGGDVTVRKRPGGQLRAVGVLTTERGRYAFQGRRFDIENGGTIRFTGNLQTPILSIVGQRTVASVQIRAALQGTPSAPELELSSTPGLEQSDILSLLIFNVPANELATGQREDLAIQAASLASGFIVSPAVATVGRALGLDYLELERGADPTSPNLRLSAGRELRPGIFVTYGHEFGATEYNEVRIDYSLARFLRLRGTVTDAPVGRSRELLFRRLERAGIDLIFFFSY